MYYFILVLTNVLRHASCAQCRVARKDTRKELAQLMIFGVPATKKAFGRIGKENWWTPEPMLDAVILRGSLNSQLELLSCEFGMSPEDIAMLIPAVLQVLSKAYSHQLLNERHWDDIGGIGRERVAEGLRSDCKLLNVYFGEECQLADGDSKAWTRCLRHLGDLEELAAQLASDAKLETIADEILGC